MKLLGLSCSSVKAVLFIPIAPPSPETDSPNLSVDDKDGPISCPNTSISDSPNEVDKFSSATVCSKATPSLSPFIADLLNTILCPS